MNKTKHYTYLITYTDGTLYHGMRSCAVDISEDNYWGSSLYTPGTSGAEKTILTEHSSREDALAEEVRYHADLDVRNDSNYHNRANQQTTGFMFDNTGMKMSEESKQRISDAMKGKPFSEDHKDNMRGSRPHCSGENHHSYGKPMSEENKAKLRGKRAHTNGKNNHKANLTIYNWSHKEHGEMTADRYELTDRFNISVKGISPVCRGVQKSYKGWSIK